MSSSCRTFNDSDASKVDLPVFATPNELIFSPSKRRVLLTVFNPYGSDAQYRIMTTSPERFDVSLTKGIIKPNRRIDITIRLLGDKIEELPEPTEELETFDYFRVSIQMGSFKGYKSIKAHWSTCAEVDSDSHVHLLAGDDRVAKLRAKSMMKTPSSQASQVSQSTSSSIPSQRSKVSYQRPTRTQTELAQSGSNVNLICTICAVACVITLFLPLALDAELCKKAKIYPTDKSSQTSGIFAELGTILSVSYEMKLGFSFALGLFTYRLISTLPD